MKKWLISAIKALEASLGPVPHEPNELDWKQNLSPKKDRLTQHLSAFANYPNGGILMFGIDNQTATPRGIQQLEAESIVGQLANLGRDALDPPVAIDHAGFLEDCSDVVSFAKNYLAVHFKLDYVNAGGDISNYYPDFMVKLSDKRIVIVETKGQGDLDVPLKMARLRQWCEDINRVQTDVEYDFVYVDEESFEKYKPTSFRQLLEAFKEYKEKI